MKIVMLTNVLAPDKAGGLERYVRELADRLAADGHWVMVLAKRLYAQSPAHEVAQSGVRIQRYAVPDKGRRLFGLLYPLDVYRAVTRVLKEVRAADPANELVLHAHFVVPALPLAIRRERYVYTFHAPVHKELLGERQGTYWLPPIAQGLAVRALRAAEAFVVRRAETVVCLSRFTQEEALALGARLERTRLVPGGLDVSSFARGDAAPVRTAGGPRLFAARRLVLRTGVEQLVEAFAQVLQELPDARLRIAGEGPRRRQVEALIEKLALEGRVDLLGRVSEASLREEYREADICVTPTQQLEGFGLSTVEAMASGSCPLVTPIGANAEVVAALDPGLVTADASPAAIAEAVVRLWLNPLWRRAVLKRASDVAQDYDWSRVVTEQLRVYSEATFRIRG